MQGLVSQVPSPPSGARSPRRREALAASLFPPAPAARGARSVAVVGYLAAAVVGFFVDLRWAGAQRTGWLWAEDGAVFLRDALRGPIWHTLAHPYAGYMHLVPRLVAAAVSAFPVQQAARLTAAAAALLRVGVALFVFRASSGHLRSPIVRFFLAALVVVLPAAGFEALDNLANIHWFLTFAAFWAILWQPARWWESALAGVVVLTAALTNPLSAVFLPLVVLRAFTGRGWRDQVVPGCYLIGVVGQLLVAATTHRPAHQSFGVLDGLEFFANRVILGTLAGYRATVWAWQIAGWGAVGVAGVVVIGIVLAALRTPGPRRWLAVSALAATVVAFAVMFAEPAVTPGTRFQLAGLQLSRYQVLPSLLLFSAIAAGLDALRRWSAVGVRAGLFVLVAVTVLLDLPATHRVWVAREGRILPWRSEVVVAGVQCQVRGATTAYLNELPAGWHVPVPCGVLEASLRESKSGG